MRTLETVDRALQLLQAFEQRNQPLTVANLAAHLGIHRSSASRLVGTLEQRGFLEHSAGSDAIRLGPTLTRLGMLALGSRDLATAARSTMEDLAAATGETAVLSVLDHNETVDIVQVDGPHLVTARQWVGRRAPLHASSDGKVLLAFAGVPLPQDRPALTPHTHTGERDLHTILDRIRDRGWALATGELEDGLNGVAAPVWDHLDRCTAVLSVSGPDYRVPATRLPALADAVCVAATQVSNKLGSTRSPGS